MGSWVYKRDSSIARDSQNAILANLLSLTRNYLQQWIVQSLDDPASSKGKKRACLSLKEHQAILKAIDSKDPVAARKSMRIHIVSSSRGLRRTPTVR